MGQRRPLCVSLKRSPCCSFLHSRLRPLAQSPGAPNSNSYTSNSFKYSPKKHVFKRIEPTSFPYPVRLFPPCANHSEDTPIVYQRPSNHCCQTQWKNNRIVHWVQQAGRIRTTSWRRWHLNWVLRDEKHFNRLRSARGAPRWEDKGNQRLRAPEGRNIWGTRVDG